jgi:hypothetical protein
MLGDCGRPRRASPVVTPGDQAAIIRVEMDAISVGELERVDALTDRRATPRTQPWRNSLAMQHMPKACMASLRINKKPRVCAGVARVASIVF